MANKNALLLIANRQVSIPESGDPDLSGLHTDSLGNLNVNVAAGGGAGGTSSVDETAFAAGVSSGTPIMGEDPTSGELLVVQLSPGTRKLAVDATVTVSPVQSNAASAAGQTTVGTTAAQVLAANANRKRMIFQNNGTTIIKLVLGAGTPTQSAYHRSLPACGVANDGSSPPYIDDMWTGAVQAISSGAGGLLNITELT